MKSKAVLKKQSLTVYPYVKRYRPACFDVILSIHQIVMYPKNVFCQICKYLRWTAVWDLSKVPQDNVMCALHGMNHNLEERREAHQKSHNLSQSIYLYELKQPIQRNQTRWVLGTEQFHIKRQKKPWNVKEQNKKKKSFSFISRWTVPLKCKK